MIDTGVVVASLTDLVRLVALPVFAWAAWKDIRTRRVANEFWQPLVLLGVVLLVLDLREAMATGGSTWELFAIRAGLAVGLVVPLAYLFWRMGGFGGADVKAVMVIALLFPTYPTYVLGTWASDIGIRLQYPLVETAVGVFSFTVLTNAVLLGAAYPLVIALRNAANGEFSKRMIVGRPVRVERLSRTYGRLLEDDDGATRRGLDLDALRMYLRWRKTDIATLRSDPDRFRDPASLPATPGEVDDGNVRRASDDGTLRTDGGTPESPDDRVERGDSSDDGGEERSGEAPGPGVDADGSDGDVPDTDRVEAPDTAAPAGERERIREEDDHEAGSEDESQYAGEDREAGDESEDESQYADPWGAEAFLEEIEGSAYGTTPDQLRSGLEVVTSEESVWVSPGIPFVLPLFLGLLAGVVYGDLLFGVLEAIGAI